MMWSEKYRPTKIEQFLGNEESRTVIVKWLSNWTFGAKPLLLIGPPGIGKTTFVTVISRQFNFDLIELNASDVRNSSQLESIIIPILNNSSLHGKEILLFLDEIDGISGREDSGGVDFITKLLKNPSVPVIMAANTLNIKIKPLAKIARVINLSPVSKQLLFIFLNHVLKNENKKLEYSDLIDIINQSKGDIRVLLTLAQSKTLGYSAQLERTFTFDISMTINNFFSSKSISESVNFLTNSEGSYVDPRFGLSPEERRKDKLYSIYTSIINSNLQGNLMYDVLDVLSMVDILIGRVGSTRKWSLLKYVDYILATYIFEHIKNKGIKYNQYNMTWSILGPIIIRSQSFKELFTKLSNLSHVSKSDFGSIYFPYLLKILQNFHIDISEFIKSLDCDEKLQAIILKEITKM